MAQTFWRRVDWTAVLFTKETGSQFETQLFVWSSDLDSPRLTNMGGRHEYSNPEGNQIKRGRLSYPKPLSSEDLAENPV